MTQKLTILFDLDGTLADTAPDLLSAHNHVMKKFGYDTKNIDEIRTKIKENYRFQKEHDKEFPFYETRLGAESYSAESMCKYCKINDPENCMYFGPTCLDAESHAYSYAYNEGHSDSRKKEEYRPNLTSARQEGDFKKILKQKGD